MHHLRDKEHSGFKFGLHLPVFSCHEDKKSHQHHPLRAISFTPANISLSQHGQTYTGGMGLYRKNCRTGFAQVGRFWCGKTAFVGKDYRLSNLTVLEIPLELSTEWNICLLDTHSFKHTKYTAESKETVLKWGSVVKPTSTEGIPVHTTILPQAADTG